MNFESTWPPWSENKSQRFIIIGGSHPVSILENNEELILFGDKMLFVRRSHYRIDENIVVNAMTV